MPGDSPQAPPSGGEETLLERAGAAAAGVGKRSDAPRTRRRAVVQMLLVGLIFAFLLGFIATQWSQLPDYSWRFETGWLALALLLVTLFYILQTEIWIQILHVLGSPMPRTPARSVYGKSLLARYVPTNALMVVGRVVMAERHGVPRRVCLASIVYELGLAFAAAVMAGAYFAIELPSLEDQPARFAILAVIPIALVGLHPRVFAPLAGFALRKLGRERLPSTLSFGQVLGFVGAYLVSWATIGLGVFAFSSALHPVEASELTYIAAAYPVAFCVAVLTFVVPGGLGTRDAALATGLAAVLPGAVATAIAVAFRIVQTGIELLFVAVVAALGRRAGRPPATGHGESELRGPDHDHQAAGVAESNGQEPERERRAADRIGAPPNA